MAWVRMLVGISGGRHDGRVWPPAGHPIEIPDWEAEHLIAGGNAEPHDGPEPEREPLLPPPPERDPVPEVVSVAPPEVSPLAEVSPVAGTSGTEEQAHAPEPEPATVVPEPDAAPPAPEEVPEAGSAQPSPSAPKKAWIDYAVSQGADVHEVSAYTKIDLMSRYGGRL